MSHEALGYGVLRADDFFLRAQVSPVPAESLPKESKVVPPDNDMVGLGMSALFAKCGEPDGVVSSAVISTLYYPVMTAQVVFVYKKHKKHVFIDRAGSVEAVSDIVK